ncbi:MAG: hypothetical protein LBL58_16630 [Tannerellaceae bacterium]|jgi:hypothetical protein|nr:hypothetical protein [Tannerellaceae bacterium]
MKVLFLPEVENYLFELAEILYQKEYFGFKENAVKYVIDLENDIRTNLINKIKRPAPPFFNRYGKKMFYSVFSKNKVTQWYVVFNVYQDNEETILLVRYITNNHMIAQFL